MTLPANLDMYISAAMFVIGGYLIALYLGMIVWTFRDIHSRTRDVLAQIMAALLVAVFTLPGLLIYFLLRPQETLSQRYERDLAEEALLHDLDEKHVCPNCQHQVESDFVICPYCFQQLRLRCIGCGRLLEPDWDVCPYCGLYKDTSDDDEGQADLQDLAADDGTESGDAQIQQDDDADDAFADGVQTDAHTVVDETADA
jgi:RNA polymerase subunit RPABC4/transcription elongation factor Spt4